MISVKLLGYEQGKDYFELSLFSVYDGMEGIDRSIFGIHISRDSIVIMFMFMDFTIWNDV
jgi:hypothetical protein